MASTVSRKKTKAAQREHANKAAYAFLAPYVILFTTFIIIPMVVAVALSFTSFDTIQIGRASCRERV